MPEIPIRFVGEASSARRAAREVEEALRLIRPRDVPVRVETAQAQGNIKRLQESSMMARRSIERPTRVNVETGNAVRKLEEVRGSAVRAHGALRDLVRIGTGMAVGFGAFELARGMVEFGKSSLDGARTFNTSMKMIVTQAGAPIAELARMKRAVLDLAPAVGMGPEKLADGLFHIESQGYRSGRALDLLTTAAKGATIGHANLEDVVKALLSTMNSHIKGVTSSSQAMEVLNRTVGIGDMRMQDLASAMGTGVVPAAANFGVSIQDLGAALATMTDSGVGAQEAATRLRMTFSLMAAPTDKAVASLKSIGLTGRSLADDIRRGGLLAAIEDLRKHLVGAGLDAVAQARVLSDAFGGGRSSSAIMTLIGQIDRFRDKTREITQTAGTFGRAWEMTTHTLAFQQERLGAGWDSIKIKIGNAMIPPLTGAVEWINHNLMPRMQVAASEISRIWQEPGLSFGDRLQESWDAIEKTGLPHRVEQAIVSGFVAVGGAIPKALWSGFTSASWPAQAAITGLLLRRFTPAFEAVGARLLATGVGGRYATAVGIGGAGGAAAASTAVRGLAGIPIPLPVVVVGGALGGVGAGVGAGRAGALGAGVVLRGGEGMTAGGLIVPGALAEAETVAARGSRLGGLATRAYSGLRTGVSRFGVGAGLGATILAPFAGDVVGGITHSKTAGSITTGALTGAGIGAMFGPEGIIAGAAIGGLVGAFKGFFHSGPDRLRTDSQAFGKAIGKDLGDSAAGEAIGSLEEKVRKGQIGAGMQRGFGMGTGAAQTREANQAAAREGQVYAASFARGIASGAKFATTGGIEEKLFPSFDRLQARARQAGSMAIIQMSAGMESAGRLPKGSTDRLIRDLEGRYADLKDYLHRQSIDSMSDLARVLNDRRAIGGMQRLVSGLKRHFDDVPKFAKVSGQNLNQVYVSAIAYLTQKVSSSTGAMKTAAIADLAAFEAGWKRLPANVRGPAQDVAGAIGLIPAAISQISSSLGSAAAAIEANLPAMAARIRRELAAAQRPAATTRDQGGVLPGRPNEPIWVMAHGGEYFVTRHQAAALDRATGVPGTLDRVITSTPQRHSQEFATGGKVTTKTKKLTGIAALAATAGLPKDLREGIAVMVKVGSGPTISIDVPAEEIGGTEVPGGRRVQGLGEALGLVESNLSTQAAFAGREAQVRARRSGMDATGAAAVRQQTSDLRQIQGLRRARGMVLRAQSQIATRIKNLDARRTAIFAAKPARSAGAKAARKRVLGTLRASERALRAQWDDLGIKVEDYNARLGDLGDDVTLQTQALVDVGRGAETAALTKLGVSSEQVSTAIGAMESGGGNEDRAAGLKAERLALEAGVTDPTEISNRVQRAEIDSRRRRLLEERQQIAGAIEKTKTALQTLDAALKEMIRYRPRHGPAAVTAANRIAIARGKRDQAQDDLSNLGDLAAQNQSDLDAVGLDAAELDLTIRSTAAQAAADPTSADAGTVSPQQQAQNDLAQRQAAAAMTSLGASAAFQAALFGQAGDVGEGSQSVATGLGIPGGPAAFGALNAQQLLAWWLALTAGQAAQPPAYQEGTDYVPRTGPAVLHAGEAVLDRRDAALFRTGRGGDGPGLVEVHVHAPSLVPASADHLRVIGETVSRSISFLGARNSSRFRYGL